MLDAFEEHFEKARQAKGLDKWQKLQGIAGRLQGKQAGDITFTCSHPSHEGLEVRHVLGSTTGNLHFLMGYGNPAFYLADYHWLIMDPNLSEDDIKDKEHPSNLKYWRAAGLETREEGDPVEGEPHPGAVAAIEQDRKEKTIEQEAVTAENGYSSYLGVPSLGLVFGLNNDHVYKWDLVKNSYLAAANPEFTEAMNSADLDEQEEVVEKAMVKLPVVLAEKYDSNVYPLVKALFPDPGTVITLGDVTAVLGSNSIDFFTCEGAPAEVLIFDRVYKSIDLTIDGDVHPEIVVNFATDVLHITLPEDINTQVVKGLPTTGYDNVPANAPAQESLRKVVVVDGLYKAIP